MLDFLTSCGFQVHVKDLYMVDGIEISHKDGRCGVFTGLPDAVKSVLESELERITGKL